MKNRKLYNKIISSIAKTVKLTINESLFDDSFLDQTTLTDQYIKEDINKDLLNKLLSNNLKLTVAEIKYILSNKNVFTPDNQDDLLDIIVGLMKNNITDLNCINTSQVTTMICLFKFVYNYFDYNHLKADIININISDWDVSNVTNMKEMFFGCTTYKFDVSNWNVSNVENMSYMFSCCQHFNCDLSKWNVSKCRDFSEMFSYCYNFNSDLSNWTVFYNPRAWGMFNLCKSLKKIPNWYNDDNVQI